MSAETIWGKEGIFIFSVMGWLQLYPPDALSTSLFGGGRGKIETLKCRKGLNNACRRTQRTRRDGEAFPPRFCGVELLAGRSIVLIKSSRGEQQIGNILPR